MLAAAVPGLFQRFDLSLGVIGYVIMRLPMVAQWLRAAREDPERRTTCRTYAAGIAVVQVLWVVLLAIPAPWAYIGFAALVIAERYGLLTLIVLGEVILGVTNAVGGAFETGFSFSLVMLALGGLLLVVGLWWTYFLGGDEHGLTTVRTALTWGYGHYLVFGAIAALGAGLEVAVDAEEHVAHVGELVAGFSVAVPVVIVLVVLSWLRRLTWPTGTSHHPIIAVASLLLLGCAALAAVVDLGLAVLLMGLVLVGALALFLTLAARRTSVSG